MAMFFIGDLHFGAEKMLKDRKSFSTVEEMDSTMIANWNDTISDNDEVYIVGDIAGSYTKNVADYIYQLHGKKHLILGNHDEEWISVVGPKFMNDNFCSVSRFSFLTIDGYTYTLCHYPMLEWWESHRSERSFMIHGHIHTRKERRSYQIIKSMPNTILNCCPDINEFRPVTINELISNNKKWYGK